MIQKNPLRRKGAEKVQSLRRGQLIKVAKSCRHRLRVEAGKVCRVCTAEGGVSRHEKALAAHADQVGLMGILPVARAVVTGIPGQDICPAHADGAQIGANGTHQRAAAPQTRTIDRQIGAPVQQGLKAFFIIMIVVQVGKEHAGQVGEQAGIFAQLQG